MGKRTNAERTDFMLRLPEELAQWLGREAAKVNRSRNAMITRILSQYREYIESEGEVSVDAER